METNEIIAFFGLGLSAIALFLGVINYRNNIRLSRRNTELNEKKIASEELKEYIDLLHATSEAIVPIIHDIWSFLSTELIELYRSVNQPMDNRFVNRPIAHHFHDLIIGLSEEINQDSRTQCFSRSLRKPIRILNIVPSKDIFPFLINNVKTNYKSFDYLNLKIGALNYAALTKVDSEDFKLFFKLCDSIAEYIEIRVSNGKLNSHLENLRIVRQKNLSQIFKIHDYPGFSKRFNITFNLLELLVKKDGVSFTKGKSYSKDLDVGCAVYYATIFQLINSVCEKYLADFKPNH